MTRVLLPLVALASIACGGIVQFEPAGEGGSGGSGGDGGTSTNTSVNQSSNQSSSVNQSSNQSQSVNSTDSVAVSTSTGPISDCESACLTLYNCGLEDMNCPGFTGSATEESFFLEGCVPSCNDQPVVIDLIDGGNCTQTIMTLKEVSIEFANLCEFGINQPPPPG